MYSHINSILSKLTLFFLFCLASNLSIAQYQKEAEENQKLIRKGATYLSGTTSTSFAVSTFENGKRGYALELSGSLLYAFSDYFAMGGQLTVFGENNTSAFPNTASEWIYALGPSIGVFIPNNTLLTPYFDLTGGFSQITIGSTMLKEAGMFYSAGLGVVAEISNRFGIALEYNYTNIYYPDLDADDQNFKTSGLAIGFLISF